MEPKSTSIFQDKGLEDPEGSLRKQFGKTGILMIREVTWGLGLKKMLGYLSWDRLSVTRPLGD
jgi:hypothetical protein